MLDCGVENVLEKVREDSRRLISALKKLDGVRLYTTAPESNIVCFNFSGLLPANSAYILGDLYGVVVRAGYHCAPLLARPFLTVRAERLIIRGIFGDSFIRVGVPERDAPEVKMLEEYINAQA